MKITKNTQFKTLLNTWLKAKQPMITPSTFANFVLITENHLIPTLGRKKIGAITEVDVQDFILHLHNQGRLDNTGGLTVKTIRDIILVLRLSLGLTILVTAGAVIMCTLSCIAEIFLL